jgi:hypothetical protein
MPGFWGWVVDPRTGYLRPGFDAFAFQHTPPVPAPSVAPAAGLDAAGVVLRTVA